MADDCKKVRSCRQVDKAPDRSAGLIRQVRYIKVKSLLKILAEIEAEAQHKDCPLERGRGCCALAADTIRAWLSHRFLNLEDKTPILTKDELQARTRLPGL